MDLCLGKYSLVLWNKEFPIVFVRNFLCVGIPYFAIGMLLKHFKEPILKFKYLQPPCFLGVIIFSITTIIEHQTLVEIHKNPVLDHYISSTFLAITLFLLFLSIKSNKNNLVSQLGEKYSLYIYIFHPLFVMFFLIINKHLPVIWQEIYLWFSPFLILFLTIILSRLLRKFQII